MLRFKKKPGIGDLVKITIDYEITESDGTKYNPKDRYGIIKTVNEEKHEVSHYRYDYFVEIQGKPYDAMWFTEKEIELIE